MMGSIRLCLLLAAVINIYLMVSSVRQFTLHREVLEVDEDVVRPPRALFTENKTYAYHAAYQSTHKGTTRPPLESLVNGTDIIGDVEFLLNFAIIGFPKTGTTSFSLWLRLHPKLEISGAEWYDLAKGKPASLASNLYMQLREGNYKRGYKAPFDVTNDALDSLKRYWPKTRLIVGLRHPVRWFESFYNYRLQRGIRMPKPDVLLRECRKGFCVKTANFHVYLARLGKTTMTAPEELQMQQDFPDVLGNLSSPMPNKVLIYDMEQMGDRNETRNAIFRRDIQEYLGLKEEMPPILHSNKGKKKKQPKAQSYIDICDASHEMLRGELVKAAKSTSVWIREHFIDSEDVAVPSRGHFEQILESWVYDPCDRTASMLTE